MLKNESHIIHSNWQYLTTLHWRHNDYDGISNHQPHGCLLNRLFGRRSKKTSKLRVTGLCAGNSPGPVNSPHKGPVTRHMFPFDDVIMKISITSEEIAIRKIRKNIICSSKHLQIAIFIPCSIWYSDRVQWIHDSKLSDRMIFTIICICWIRWHCLNRSWFDLLTYMYVGKTRWVERKLFYFDWISRADRVWSQN